FGVEQIVFDGGATMTRSQILSAASAVIAAETTTISGTSGNNNISVYDGNFVVNAGAGTDTMTARSSGWGTYQFASSDGTDELRHSWSNIVRNDTLHLTDANASDVTLSRDGGSLVVTIDSTGASFTVEDQFYWNGTNPYGISTIKFADGSTWSRDYISGLVSGNFAPEAEAVTAEALQDASLLRGTLTVTDANEEDYHTFKLDERVAGLVVNLDGTWSFDPGDDAYSHLGEGDDQTITASFSVTDQEGLSTTSTLTIKVTGVDDLPTVTKSLENKRLSDGGTLSYELATRFADADGDALTLTASLADGSGLPSWLSFDGKSLSGTAPLGQSGVVEVRVRASDGSFSASDTFLLHYGNGNDAPVEENALPAAEAVIGVLTEIHVPWDTFADPDGDTLSLSVTLADGSPLPSWLAWANGRLIGTPPSGSAGEYSIKVSASDGSAVAHSTFSLTVASYRTFLGTADDDWMQIPSGGGLANGLAGNDNINGSDSDDIIVGGIGNDSLYG
ncbi:MAG: hypothetical protein EON58_16765, partial [Alphaproteobacteria bacterium]